MDRRRNYMRRRRDRMRSENDYRNPYGSRGGYVVSRRGRGRDRDMREDYERDYARYDREYNRDYDYEYDREYRSRDYARYDYAEEDEEYKEDLEEWCEKLKRKDRFKIPKEQIIQRAKSMGVKFDEYEEDEFLTAYYYVMNAYPTATNDYNVYLKMAKEFLEEKDIAVSPSEKLCIYMYKIVKGEE